MDQNEPVAADAAGVLAPPASSSRTVVLSGVDAAVREEHIRSMIAVLLGPEAMTRRPIASVTPVRGGGGFKIQMMRSRHAEAVRTAMHGGVVNGAPVSVLYDVDSQQEAAAPS
jgi:hypothetical protein